MNGIQAAWAEHRGEGTLSAEGKAIVFRNNAGRTLWKAWTRTTKQAAEQLRLLRAAPKYQDTQAA